MKQALDVRRQLPYQLLSAVLHFMKQSGTPMKEIEAAIADGLSGLRESAGPEGWLRISAPRPGDETVESAVLRLWHRHTKYIDVNANPKPLRLYGRAPSVESLVRIQNVSANARNVIQGMRSAGLIRRGPAGSYLPKGDAATIGHLHPLAIEHVAKSVMRMLGTVLRNTDPSRAQVPLIERSARVPDLDTIAARDFAEFTRKQGIAYLQAVDDWLETRRIASKPGGKSRRRRSIGAGVHLYAYMGNDSDDLVSLDLAGRAAEFSQRLSSAAPCESAHAAEPCTMSGAAS